MNDKPAFCPTCGAHLGESNTFCAKCGAGIDDESTTTSPKMQNSTSQRSTIMWVIIILAAIWAVFAIIWGIWAIISAQAQIDGALTSDILDTLNQFDIDPQTLVTAVQAIGAVFLISGIMAAMTAVLVLLRKQHTIALILCIIGSILALIALVGIIGLIMAYYLNKSKGEFIS
jgi:magnesium-transporting ATPase (P-type)